MEGRLLRSHTEKWRSETKPEVVVESWKVDLGSTPHAIVVMGWAGAGKTETSEGIRNATGIHWVDIDLLREILFGAPNPHPKIEDGSRARDILEISSSYNYLLSVADWHLANNRHIGITSTFSSFRYYQIQLMLLRNKYPKAKFSIIWCVPENDTDEAVLEMFRKRQFGEGGYRGSVNSLERYREVQGRFDPPDQKHLPHLRLPTWGSPNDTTTCVLMALEYIQSQSVS